MTLDDFRKAVALASDEQLTQMLLIYAVGDIAGWLVSEMDPGARQAFFALMRQRYPECFQVAGVVS